MKLPALDVPIGTLHPHARPIAPLSKMPFSEYEQPYDVAVRKEGERTLQVQAASQTFERQGGSRAVEAASILVRCFRRLFLSKSNQKDALKTIRELHQKRLVDLEIDRPGSAAPGCLLPLSISALEGRAVDVPKAQDVERRSLSFSTVPLRQQQQKTEMVVGDMVALIQDILDDRSIDHKSLCFLKKEPENSRASYTLLDGTPVQGPELHHGMMWNQREESIPEGGTIMTIVLFTDETFSRGGKLYPGRLSIGNMCLEERVRDSGSALFGLLSNVRLGKPRGLSESEGIDRYQRNYKDQIYASSLAHFLADLDHLSQQELSFRRWDTDDKGRSIQAELKVFIRAHLYVSDQKEGHAQAGGISRDQCERCFGHSVALEREVLDGRADATTQLAHLRTDDGATCPAAERRTPLKVAQIQGEIMKVARTKGLGAADKLEKKYGVRSGVEVMLCRLPSLVPHKSGGPFSLFGTDLLHVLDLGVTKKFLAMLDAFMIKFRQKGADSEIQSKEDVRSRVDQVVASVPTHPGELTFDLGWYGGEGDGGGSASENAALLKLAYFAYVSDPGLIYDDERRQRMLRMHKLLIEVGQELRTP